MGTGPITKPSWGQAPLQSPLNNRLRRAKLAERAGQLPLMSTGSVDVLPTEVPTTKEPLRRSFGLKFGHDVVKE